MLLRVVFWAAVIYVALGGILFFSQRRILFPASRDVYRTPDVLGWSYDDVMLDVAGEQTHGWFVPAPDEAAGTVLFSHGNAGNIADRLESVNVFRAMNLNVFVYDYGGYGRSTGRPSEQRCYADAAAAWDYLTEERGIPAEEIVLFGRSLGAAVTLDLAAHTQPAGVIAESAFTSTADMARALYPMYPMRWLVRHRFENLAKVDQIAAPLLIIHGRQDTLVPFRHGEKLYERANAPKAFLELSGDHNEGFIITGPTYAEGLRSFIHAALEGRDLPEGLTAPEGT